VSYPNRLTLQLREFRTRVFNRYIEVPSNMSGTVDQVHTASAEGFPDLIDTLKHRADF
jgi:hypothetical protein